MSRNGTFDFGRQYILGNARAWIERTNFDFLSPSEMNFLSHNHSKRSWLVFVESTFYNFC